MYPPWQATIYEVETVEGTTIVPIVVVYAHGSLTEQDTDHFTEIITGVLNSKAQRVLLDVTSLEYCSLEGVSLLVLADEFAKKKKKAFAIYNPTGLVHLMFEQTRLNLTLKILSYYPDKLTW